ncbi:MAG: hypothetical protein ABIS06_03505 [Vicinamibacterales bacterium]
MLDNRVRAASLRHGQTPQGKEPSRPTRPRFIPLILLRAALALGINVTPAVIHATHTPTGTVRVEVVDAGKRVAGASVSAGGQSRVMDAAGVARLSVPPGAVSVTVTKT